MTQFGPYILDERKRRKGVLKDVYWDAIDLGFYAVTAFDKKLGDFVNVISRSQKRADSIAKDFEKKYGLKYQIKKLGSDWKVTFWSPELVKEDKE